MKVRHTSGDWLLAGPDEADSASCATFEVVGGRPPRVYNGDPGTVVIRSPVVGSTVELALPWFGLRWVHRVSLDGKALLRAEAA